MNSNHDDKFDQFIKRNRPQPPAPSANEQAKIWAHIFSTGNASYSKKLIWVLTGIAVVCLVIVVNIKRPAENQLELSKGSLELQGEESFDDLFDPAFIENEELDEVEDLVSLAK